MGIVGFPSGAGHLFSIPFFRPLMNSTGQVVCCSFHVCLTSGTTEIGIPGGNKVVPLPEN